MQMVNLDSLKVKQVTNASRTATATMILLGFRQRAHSFINLLSVKRELQSMNEHVVDKDYMDFWRGLEEAGAGSIIVGRRGKQTRFEWNYSLKQVASVAIEGKNSVIDKLSKKHEQFTAIKALPKLDLKPLEVIKVKPIELKAKEVKRGRGRPKGSKNVVKLSPKKVERVIYNIPLRADFTLDISLPADVTAEEFKKIKKSLSIQIK